VGNSQVARCMVGNRFIVAHHETVVNGGQTKGRLPTLLGSLIRMAGSKEVVNNMHLVLVRCVIRQWTNYFDCSWL